jgi:hypothetical protein
MDHCDCLFCKSVAPVRFAAHKQHTSIVRATQFFEFVEKIADLSTEGNKVRLPLALFQPIQPMMSPVH